MLGSILGAGAGVIGSIFGGISASKAMKRVKNNLEKQKAANQDWFDRRYNEDATQRADAQAILTRTEESIRNRNRQAAGTQAVMGGTEESVAAAKAANNEALATATTNIAINGEARKDRIEEAFQRKDERLDDKLNDMEMNRAQSIREATSGVGQATGDMGAAIDEYVDHRRLMKG